TLRPERTVPVSVPSATTPLAVAWKLVIFAFIEKLDDEAASAEAGTANATAAASAARTAVRGLMARHDTAINRSNWLSGSFPRRPASRSPATTAAGAWPPDGT